MTFGAPMVLHAAEPTELFERLRALEAAAEASGGRAGGGAVLQFHNFVNNADVVRLVLGSPFTALPGICACLLRKHGVSVACEVVCSCSEQCTGPRWLILQTPLHSLAGLCCSSAVITGVLPRTGPQAAFHSAEHVEHPAQLFGWFCRSLSCTVKPVL